MDKMARFVMFKAPFEHVLSPVIFEEIEEKNDRVSTPEYRLFPVRQEELLKDGCELEEEEENSGFRVKSSELTTLSTPPLDLSSRSGEKSQTKGRFEGSGIVRDKKSAGILIKSAKYIGNKWGGKYLRAPDIYWTILEKGKGKLVRLGDIAEVRRGFTTGANEFFYLDEAKIREWGIEEEFLKPVIKSPRECKRILIDPKDLKYKIFMCHKEKKDLKDTAALEYIKWGESRGFHARPSCAGRARWWQASDEIGNTFWGKEVRERIAVFCSTEYFFADCRLYVTKVETWLQGVLNSTLTAFISEAMARDLGGGGGPRSMMVYEVQNILVVETPDVKNDMNIKKLLFSIGRRELPPFIKDINNTDRKKT